MKFSPGADVTVVGITNFKSCQFFGGGATQGGEKNTDAEGEWSTVCDKPVNGDSEKGRKMQRLIMAGNPEDVRAEKNNSVPKESTLC